MTVPSRAIETRAEVEALTDLHGERRKVIEVLAPLDLLFAAGGDRWTARRRRHRDGVAKLVREELFEKWRNAGAKGEWKEPSEAMLERMANCEPRHVDYVEEVEATYPEWMRLKNELSEIEERIRSRELELIAYNSELKLAR